jgi:hypothetical protein
MLSSTTTRVTGGGRRQRWRIAVAVLAVELVVGLMAVPCGIGLMIDGLGIPRSELEGTPFDSFVIPGLLLSVVVGGSLLAAAWTVWRHHPLAPLASLAAGCVLLGWIVVETVLIGNGRALQTTFFVVALLIIGLSWHLQRDAASAVGRPPR